MSVDPKIKPVMGPKIKVDTGGSDWRALSINDSDQARLRALEKARTLFRSKTFNPKVDDIEDVTTGMTMNERRLFSNGELVYSGGLGNCVGIVMLEKGTGKAIASHSIFHGATNDAREMAKVAQALFSKSKVEIFLCGNDVRDVHSEQNTTPGEECKRLRREIYDALTKEFGFKHSQVKAEWGKAGHTTGYFLDVEVGKIKVFQERNEN